MNIYIYGNDSFRKSIHTVFDHANLKFKLTGQSQIIDVKTKKKLESLLKDEPDSIYLIDDWKIIRKKHIFWKLLSMVKFLLPSDAIEEELLLSSGVVDIVSHSISELPKIILLRNQQKNDEIRKKYDERRVNEEIEEENEKEVAKIDEEVNRKKEPLAEEKKELKLDLDFDKIGEDYRLKNELNVLLAPKEKNREKSISSNSELELEDEQAFDENRQRYDEDDDEDEFESFDNAMGFEDRESEDFKIEPSGIDFDEKLRQEFSKQKENTKPAEPIKKEDNTLQSEEIKKEKKIPYDFLAKNENREEKEIEEEIKFFDALNVTQLDEIEMTNEDFINEKDPYDKDESEEDEFENFVDLSSLDNLDENDLNSAFSSK